MPVRKRKDRRRHAVPDWKTEIDLDIGWLSDRSDDEMRAAWETYRDYMMALPRPAGTRPVAWWVLERDVDAPPSGPAEAQALFEMGELDDDEVAELRRDWSDMPVEQRPRFLDAGKELPWTPF